MKMRTSLLFSAALLAFAVLMSGIIATAQGPHDKFNDHDRQVAHDYYNNHRDHPPVGLRDQDRLSSDLASRLVVGAVLGADFRAHEHTVPHALLVQLGPAPHGCRYVLVGHHVVMLDHGNHVIDVIQLD